MMDQQREWIARLPLAVLPFYEQIAPNEPIGLYRGPLRITRGRLAASGDGIVALHWNPGPDVKYQCEAQLASGDLLDGFEFLMDDVPEDVALVNDAEFVPLQVRDMQPPAAAQAQGSMQLDGRARGIRRSDRSVAKVVFGVVNLGNYHGNWVRVGERQSATGIELVSGAWRVRMSGVDDLDDRLKALGQVGGYLITHNAQLERVDGKPFSTKTANRMLEALTMLLWFGRGLRTAPVLPVGFDSEGNPTWTRWDVPNLDRWDAPFSWLDPIYGAAQIQELFPGFMKLWRSPLWREALKLAINYYLDANVPSTINSGILSSQIALELLAWTVLVEERRELTETQFRATRFSALLRAMLAHSGLPKEVPVELASLRRHVRRMGWEDGPHALAMFRNEVAHLRGRSETSFNAWVDGWRLSTWYLELLLLGIMGFHGSYANRLRPRPWAGQIEGVPWVESKPT